MLALVQDPLLSRVDRRLAAILGGSIALHIAIAAYAWAADVEEPEPVTASAIPVEYQEIDIMIPDFTKPEIVTNTPGPGAANPVAPNQTPHPIVRRPTVRPQITTGQQIDPSKLDGFFVDEGPSRRPTLDLAGQIREVRDGNVEIGPNRTPPEDRPRIGTTPELPLTENPELTHVDPTHHDGPPGRVIPGPVEPKKDTTLTAALVLQIIQSQYMRGLQRCYSRGLASEGSLSGKVALQFTVGPTGQVTAHSASGVSDSVESCIDGQMSTWRFPIPRDDKGNAKDAPFAVTLALQPS
jgi:hypothetical protein